MSIVLKTDLQHLLKVTRNQPSRERRDALAAHAMQMAIEEAKAACIDPAFGNTFPGPFWIERRAAANLARLMGEGNG